MLSHWRTIWHHADCVIFVWFVRFIVTNVNEFLYPRKLSHLPRNMSIFAFYLSCFNKSIVPILDDRCYLFIIFCISVLYVYADVVHFKTISGSIAKKMHKLISTFTASMEHFDWCKRFKSFSAIPGQYRPHKPAILSTVRAHEQTNNVCSVQVCAVGPVESEHRILVRQ